MKIAQHILHYTHDEARRVEVHLWSREAIHGIIESNFCKDCKTSACCEFCPLNHLVSDLNMIENRTVIL